MSQTHNSLRRQQANKVHSYARNSSPTTGNAKATPNQTKPKNHWKQVSSISEKCPSMLAQFLRWPCGFGKAYSKLVSLSKAPWHSMEKVSLVSIFLLRTRWLCSTHAEQIACLHATHLQAQRSSWDFSRGSETFWLGGWWRWGGQICRHRLSTNLLERRAGKDINPQKIIDCTIHKFID